MFSYMEIYKRRSTCSNLQVLLLRGSLVECAFFESQSTALSNLLEHGLKNWVSILIVYVDDIVSSRSDNDCIQQTKN